MNVKAQCSELLDLTASSCFGDSITIQNPNSQGEFYNWDFCTGDLKNDPTAIDFGKVGVIGRSDAITWTQENGVYHVFMATVADELHHLVLNENLDSVVSTQNYGNPGGLLKFATGIRLIKDHDIWKAIIINANSGKFIQLNFRNGLNAAPTDQIDYGNLGLLNNPKEIDAYQSGNDIAVAITNEVLNTITTIYFTDSISISTMSVNSFDVNGATLTRGVSITKTCNEWNLFVSTSNTLYLRFKLGTDFTNTTPVRSTLPFDVVASRRIHALRDGHHNYILIPTNGGTYKLDYGENYDNTPTVTNLGTFSFVQNLIGFHFQNINSHIIGFGTNLSTHNLYKIEFPNNCSFPFSSNETDPSLKISGDSSQKIFVELLDSSGIQYVYHDSIKTFPSPEIHTIEQLTCTDQNTHFIDLSTSFNGQIVTRAWDIGGVLSSDSAVSLIFPSAGNVPFYLKIEDEVGCSAEINDTAIIVSENDIKSNFILPAITCTNTEITFVDSSISSLDSISSWLWNFGDSLSNDQNTSNAQNGSHIFLQSGNYDVQLTVFGKSGCSSTLTKKISVGVGPNVQFSSEIVCFGDTSVFLNSSSGTDIIKYKWFFGDGDSLVQESANHLYSSVDTFNVRLEVTNNTGCKSVQTQNAIVIGLPVANFNTSISCAQIPTSFQDNSMIQNDNISQYFWTFDLTNTNAVSSDNNPIYSFPFAGDYESKLVIVTESGCTDSITKTVKSYYCETSLPNGRLLCLNDSLKVSSNPTNEYYQWDFCFGEMNGFPAATNFGKQDNISRSDAITWVADSGMTYVFIGSVSEEFFRLAIPDSTGLISEVTNLGKLNSLLKLPSGIDFIKDNGIWKCFISNANSAKVTQVVFGDGLSQAPTSTIDMGNFGFLSNPSDLDIWRDGSDIGMAISNQFNHSITLVNFSDSINGQMTVTDFVVDASSIKGISLIKTKNEWNVFASISPTDYLRIKLGSDLKNPIVQTLTLDISVPTGRHLNVIKDGPNHHLIIPTSSGIYQLKYGDDFDNDPEIVNLGNFGYITNIIGFGFENRNSKILGFGTNLSTHEIYQLSFDNITCSSSLKHSEDSVQYISYPNVGQYYVFADMVNIDGIQIELYDSIEVLPSPIASINSNRTCTEELAEIIDMSTSLNGQIINRNWTVNSTETGSDSIYTQLFLNTGLFPVNLTVSDNRNCSSSVNDTIRIVDRLDITPDFSFVDPLCTFDNALFTDNSVYSEDTITQWHWQFGDTLSQASNESLDTNGVHTFDFEGAFEVTLTVTGTSGCSRDTTISIQTIAGPSVDFLTNERCLYDSVMFIDNTTGNNITDYSWNLGDGTFATSINTSHKYDSARTYTVTLTVSNAVGCENTFERQHNVYPIPTSEFDVDLSCTGLPTQFYDRSNVISGTLEQWFWDFGTTALTDTSSNQNSQFAFDNPVQQFVTLVVSTDHDCKDTSNQSPTTLQSPEANFQFSDVCLGEFTEFLDFSTSSTSNLQEWLWTVNEKSGIRFYSNQNPAHQFSEPDSFNVILKVTDAQGCSDTSSRKVFIPNLPTPLFKYSASCSNAPVSFYNSSISPFDSVIEATWLFENLGFKNGDTATVTYPEAITDRVHLNITTQRGCSSEIIKSISILSNPISSFNISPTFGEAPLDVETDNISINSTDFSWTVSGNDDTLSSLSPIFTFIENGDYTITLVASNGSMCRDTNSVLVSVGETEVDLAITNVLPFHQEGKVRFAITIENNSSISISNPSLEINWSTKINEETSLTLSPGQITTYITSSSLDSNQFLLEDYFCFNVMLPSSLDIEDINLNNNDFCLTLTTSPTVLTLYPNPAFESTSLTIYSPTTGTSTINLFDEIGRWITNFDVTLEKGPNTVMIDTSYLSSGQYYIMVDSSGNIEMINLLKF